jgi:predicted ester cyclase
MDAKAIIRKEIELWNAHDRDAFLALYDDSVVLLDQPTGQQLTGREEFGKSFYDPWTDAYPDSELKDPVVFGEGELVCLQRRFAGTNTGILHSPAMEIAPTGRPVDGPFVFIAEARDGRVARAWNYYDRLRMFGPLLG